MQSINWDDLRYCLAVAWEDSVTAAARKLEEAQYVSCTKYFHGRLPRTEYRLTPSGRRALERYLVHMEALIRATRDGRDR